MQEEGKKMENITKKRGRYRDKAMKKKGIEE